METNNRTPFTFCDCPVIDAKNQVTEFSIESHALSVIFLSMTRLKKIKPVVTEKHQFDIQGDSILITVFANFGQSAF